MVVFVSTGWADNEFLRGTTATVKTAFPYLSPVAEQRDILLNAFNFQMSLFGAINGTGKASIKALNYLALTAVLVGALMIIFNPKHRKMPVIAPWVLLVIVTVFAPYGSMLLFYPLAGDGEIVRGFGTSNKIDSSSCVVNPEACGFTPQLAGIHVASILQLTFSDIFNSKQWKGLMDQANAQKGLESNTKLVSSPEWPAKVQMFSNSCGSVVGWPELMNRRIKGNESTADNAYKVLNFQDVWPLMVGPILDKSLPEMRMYPPMAIELFDESNYPRNTAIGPGTAAQTYWGVSSTVAKYQNGVEALYHAVTGNSRQSVRFGGGDNAITVEKALQEMNAAGFFNVVNKGWFNDSIDTGFFFTWKDSDSYKNNDLGDYRQCYNGAQGVTGRNSKCAATLGNLYIPQAQAESLRSLIVPNEGSNSGNARPAGGSGTRTGASRSANTGGTLWPNLMRNNLLTSGAVADMPVSVVNFGIAPATGGPAPMVSADPLLRSEPVLDCLAVGNRLIDEGLNWTLGNGGKAKQMEPLRALLVDQRAVPKNTEPNAVRTLKTEQIWANVAGTTSGKYSRVSNDTAMAKQIIDAFDRAENNRKQYKNAELDDAERYEVLLSLMVDSMNGATNLAQKAKPTAEEEQAASDRTDVNMVKNVPLTFLGGWATIIGGQVLAKIGSWITGPLSAAIVYFLSIFVDMALIILVVLTPILFFVGLAMPGAAMGVMTIAVMGAFILKTVPITLLVLNNIGGMIYDMIGAGAGSNAGVMQDLMILAMAGLYANVVGMTFFLLFKLGDPSAVLSRFTALDGAAKDLAEKGKGAAIAAATVAAGLIGAGVAATAGNTMLGKLGKRVAKGTGVEDKLKEVEAFTKGSEGVQEDFIGPRTKEQVAPPEGFMGPLTEEQAAARQAIEDEKFAKYEKDYKDYAQTDGFMGPMTKEQAEAADNLMGPPTKDRAALLEAREAVISDEDRQFGLDSKGGKFTAAERAKLEANKLAVDDAVRVYGSEDGVTPGLSLPEARELMARGGQITAADGKVYGVGESGQIVQLGEQVASQIGTRMPQSEAQAAAAAASTLPAAQAGARDMLDKVTPAGAAGNGTTPGAPGTGGGGTVALSPNTVLNVNVQGGQLGSIGEVGKVAGLTDGSVKSQIAQNEAIQVAQQNAQTNKELDEIITSKDSTAQQKAEALDLKQQNAEVSTAEQQDKVREKAGRLLESYNMNQQIADMRDQIEKMPEFKSIQAKEAALKELNSKPRGADYAAQAKKLELSSTEKRIKDNYDTMLKTDTGGMVQGEMGKQLATWKNLQQALQMKGVADTTPSNWEAFKSGVYGSFAGGGGGLAKIPVIGPAITESVNEYLQAPERARAWKMAGGYKEWKQLNQNAQRGAFLQKEVSPMAAGHQYESMLARNGFQAQYEIATQAAREAVEKSRAQYEAMLSGRKDQMGDTIRADLRKEIVNDTSLKAELDKLTPSQREQRVQLEIDSKFNDRFNKMVAEGKIGAAMTSGELIGIGRIEAADRIASVRQEAMVMQRENLMLKVAKKGLDGNMLMKEIKDASGRVIGLEADTEDVSVPLTADFLNKFRGDILTKSFGGKIDEMMASHYGIAEKQYLRGDIGWDRTRSMSRSADAAAAFVRKDVDTDYLIAGHLKMVQGKEGFKERAEQYNVLLEMRNDENQQKAAFVEKMLANDKTMANAIDKAGIGLSNAKFNGLSGKELQVAYRLELEKVAVKELKKSGKNLKLEAIFDEAASNGGAKYQQKAMVSLYNTQSQQVENWVKMQKAAADAYSASMPDIKNFTKNIGFEVSGTKYSIDTASKRWFDKMENIVGGQITELDKMFVEHFSKRQDAIKVNVDKESKTGSMRIDRSEWDKFLTEKVRKYDQSMYDKIVAAQEKGNKIRYADKNKASGDMEFGFVSGGIKDANGNYKYAPEEEF